MEDLNESYDFRVVKSETERLHDENRELKQRVDELEEQIKKLKEYFEYMSNEHRYSIMKTNDIINKFDSITMPMLQNMVLSDREKVREYVYG